VLGGASLGERFLDGRGAEFTALLETLGEAVTIRDLNDKLVYANRAALQQLGFETLEELQRQPLEAMMDEYVVHDEHGRPLTMADIPSVRLLNGEAAEPLLIHTVSAATGDSRWHLLKAAGLSDGAGRMVAAVTVIEDVSAVKTAEVHMRILSESGRVLASSLDLRETLANVAEVGVPGLADWCVVDLIDEALIREHVAIAHRDPDRRELVRQMRELEPAQIDPGSTIGRVFLSGASELFFDVPDGHLFEVAAGEERLRILQALAIRSAVAVPMRTRGRTVGVMTCCTSESQRRLTKVDLELAEQLAARAAMAVDNSRLHTTLGRVSETLQQSLRPNDLPPVPGWQVAALYRPAGAAQRIEVGGDFYEILTDGQDCLALIGDVTGHGVTAATLTALLRHGARFASRVEPEPAAILHRLDEVLRERAGTSLCTALCARIGEGTLVLSSAGHPPALIVDADGTVTETPTPGPLLGAFADATWT
jgi:PAS domain S-box-containing protein